MPLATSPRRYNADPSNPDNSAAKQEAYCLRLEGMSDAELEKAAAQMIWLSAYAGNNPRSCYHWQCDAAWDEAQRRGKPEIYERAYKSASAGAP